YPHSFLKYDQLLFFFFYSLSKMTTAKSSTNVEQAFMTMAAEIKKRMGPGATAGGSEKSNVKIQSTPTNDSNVTNHTPQLS
uniref:Uncharacterized protein n=1 Tax=Cyprinus carpio TaxID=7962 RepID=A0A8C1Z839_CYPCA